MDVLAVTTDRHWQEAQRIRQRVFVEEQACPPDEEWDAWDAAAARGRTCHHLLGQVDGTPVATARWRPVTYRGRAAAKLERFAVLPAWRGRGLGRAIVEAAIREAQQAGFATLVLHAQAHLEPLYAAFGFEPVGPVFEEAGIPHIAMVRGEDSLRGEA
ncbi:MAG: GNAT family N-acetyltransferase [Bacteroidota bacterium]